MGCRDDGVTAASVCPHCGYNLVAYASVLDGSWSYEPAIGLRYEDRPVPLSPARALLVGALLRAQGRALSKNALLGAMGSEDATEESVNVQVCHIRRIMQEAGTPCPIETIWGFGYRWDRTGDHQIRRASR